MAAESHALASWLEREDVRELTRQYTESLKTREIDMGFNLFHLISDSYHRENLHSDMMEAILSPTGSHGQNDLFLRKFLEFLKARHGVNLRLEDYQTARVVREESRIDLLIYDETSHKAIIIENKINGAPDMDKQLVRYLEKVTKEWGYECDAIVYLTLNQKKFPDTPDWTDVERNRVNKLLQVICAYDESKNADLCAGWLTCCIETMASSEARGITSIASEAVVVLQQYRQLLQKLGQTMISKPVMQNFFELLNRKDNFDVARNVAELFANLPTYRCSRLYDKFTSQKEPFSSFFRYPNSPSSTLAIFRGIYGHPNIKLDLDCSAVDSTKVVLWNNTSEDPDSEDAGKILEKIGLKGQMALLPYTDQNKGFIRTFKFPTEEDSLVQFVCTFKKALKEYLSTI